MSTFSILNNDIISHLLGFCGGEYYPVLSLVSRGMYAQIRRAGSDPVTTAGRIVDRLGRKFCIDLYGLDKCGPELPIMRAYCFPENVSGHDNLLEFINPVRFFRIMLRECPKTFRKIIGDKQFYTGYRRIICCTVVAENRIDLFAEMVDKCNLITSRGFIRGIVRGKLTSCPVWKEAGLNCYPNPETDDYTKFYALNRKDPNLLTLVEEFSVNYDKCRNIPVWAADFYAEFMAAATLYDDRENAEKICKFISGVLGPEDDYLIWHSYAYNLFDIEDGADRCRGIVNPLDVEFLCKIFADNTYEFLIYASRLMVADDNFLAAFAETIEKNRDIIISQVRKSRKIPYVIAYGLKFRYFREYHDVILAKMTELCGRYSVAKALSRVFRKV